MTNEQGYVNVLKWTISEAAQQCEVSRSTIRRYRDQGKFPNAEKTLEGWVIPVNDLISAGLKPGKPKAGDDVLTEQGQPDTSIAQELIELRAALKIEQAHRQAAELIAAEREQALKDMRQAMRMIEAAPAQTFAPDSAQKATPHANDEPRPVESEPVKPRKWLGRFLKGN